jgi:hypothetical protein
MGESSSGDQGQDTNEFTSDADLDQIARDADQIASERDRGDEDTTDSLTALDLQQVQNRAGGVSDLQAFGGQGGGLSTQATAGMQSPLGDLAGGSLRELDPLTGQTTTFSPTQVPQLELMPEVPYDIFGMQNRVNKILEDRDAQGLYTQVTRDELGNVTGAFNDAPLFGLNFLPDVRTYTGLDQNPYNLDRDMGDDNNNMTVPTSTNPITGKEQCPDGYVFDSDLQACRLKTKADDAVGTPKNPPDANTPAFTRNYSLLNTAPSNLPQGFDYNQANQNFMSRFATRPSIFKSPPSLLGYTPFRSS